MGSTRQGAFGLLLPAGLALAITVGYFIVTGGWTDLGNPIAGMVAVTAGAIGFAAGVILQS